MSSDYLEYDENLAFKPKMTWEELKEFASKYKGYKDCGEYFCLNNNIKFCKEGSIYVYSISSLEGCIIPLADSLPYQKIKNIIMNQFEEVK